MASHNAVREMAASVAENSKIFELGWRVAQTVRCLLSKCEVLSLNASFQKRKRYLKLHTLLMAI
jgi:hypothetical protein